MRCFLLIIVTLFSVAASAQTDYDIRSFLSFADKETPQRKNLSFYLKAGEKLLADGNVKEADVCFDFAACLGSPEGFMGKAQTCEDSNRAVYLAFGKRQGASVRKLLSALSSSSEDLESALLVHDNLEVFCLKHLTDPLIRWMPTNKKDSSYLCHHDDIAYLVASIKEAEGNRFEALALYELAAWQGNFQALQKAQFIGTETEIKWKKALIGRKNNNREFIALHKYFAGEPLTSSDYRMLIPLMTEPEESLIARVLSISKESNSRISQLAEVFAFSTQVRQQLSKNGYLIQYFSDAINEAEFESELYLVAKANQAFSDKMRDNIKHLEEQEAIVAGKIQVNVEYKIAELREYLQRNARQCYAQKTIELLEAELTQRNEPYWKEILDVLHDLPTDDTIICSKRQNLYYPLFETGLFHTVHYSRPYSPRKLTIAL